MPHLRRRVNEFQADFLLSNSASLCEQAFPHRDDALFCSHEAALDHHPIFIDLAVVGKATHGSDAFLRQIVFCHSVVGVFFQIFTHPVNLFVDFRTMMVTTLTRSRNLELHPSRVPCSDTSHFTKTSMRFAWKTSAAPSSNYTMKAMTLCDTNYINHFVLSENICHLHFPFKQAHDKIYFLFRGASIDLDFFDMRFLGSNFGFTDLCVANRTDDLAIFFLPVQSQQP